MIADPGKNKYKLLGGDLSLDFVNTVNWRKRNEPDELLKTSQDLISWGVETDILSEPEADKMNHWAHENKSTADNLLVKAKDLRESLHHLFKGIIEGNEPNENDLNVINYELSEMLTHLQLSYSKNQFKLEIEKDNTLDYVIWHIVRSASKLLTSDKLDRVKECEDDECGWLFIDESKNRSRRWCSMEDCGNRNKARRHYRSTRKS
jgi:predicted RNA-binding Zn ribbon-like protein